MPTARGGRFPAGAASRPNPRQSRSIKNGNSIDITRNKNHNRELLVKRLCYLTLVVLLGIRVCSAGQIPVNGSIDYDAQNPSRGIVVTWEAIPGKLYEIQSTAELERQVWKPVTAAPIFATNNLVRFREQPNQSTRFYKIVKLDSDPPEIWRHKPESGAIAVPRQGPLKAYLRDETGVDPESIALSLGTNPPVTLADPRLSFTNGTLSFTPATGWAAPPMNRHG